MCVAIDRISLDLLARFSVSVTVAVGLAIALDSFAAMEYSSSNWITVEN